MQTDGHLQGRDTVSDSEAESDTLKCSSQDISAPDFELNVHVDQRYDTEELAAIAMGGYQGQENDPTSSDVTGTRATIEYDTCSVYAPKIMLILGGLPANEMFKNPAGIMDEEILRDIVIVAMGTAVPGLGRGLVDSALVAHYLIHILKVYLRDRSKDNGLHGNIFGYVVLPLMKFAASFAGPLRKPRPGYSHLPSRNGSSRYTLGLIPPGDELSSRALWAATGLRKGPAVLGLLTCTPRIDPRNAVHPLTIQIWMIDYESVVIGLADDGHQDIERYLVHVQPPPGPSSSGRRWMDAAGKTGRQVLQLLVLKWASWTAHRMHCFLRKGNNGSKAAKGQHPGFNASPVDD
ncbi:hypothetical protein CMUS01_07907 [Colletotrichum musicola]|uniref:Uncharacterized protein n=1 Tax=Colletotrichum musicola TaxID=2175873 RepID=A0A8H6NEX4_9PEZI|nr:hypothetical protein CMUS01_07907 [Colletotrichum musicola]